MAQETSKLPPTIEIGSTGLNRAGGYIVEEFLPALSGGKAAKVYREMADNDATVGAILFAINMLSRQVEWTVQAVDDSPKAQEAADFVSGCMDDMSHTWGDFVAESLSMLAYGFAPLEVVWKRRIGPNETDGSRRSRFSDGKFGIRKISLRAQDTVQHWEFDENGGVAGLWQYPPDSAKVFIPIERLLLMRTTPVKNNPEGRSILRSAYRAWLFKKHIEEIEGIGIERDLAGYPAIYAPGRIMASNATEDERLTFLNLQSMITNIRRDAQEGVILPGDRDESGNRFYELHLLSTGGSRTFDTNAIVDRYDRRIAMSVLADFLFLGQGSSGSWALSSNKTALFATAIGTFLGTIRDTVNRHLLPRLWALNGMDPEYIPTCNYGDIEKPDLDQLANFVKSMAGAGATLFPDRELENSLRRTAGLPLAPEEGVEGDPTAQEAEEDENSTGAAPEADDEAEAEAAKAAIEKVLRP